MAGSVTTLDLLRHGEPDGGSKIRGSGVDDPLSGRGWEQMQSAVGDHSPWDAVVTSPLRRCEDFAARLAERHRLPLARDLRLREIGFGAWEGRTHADLAFSGGVHWHEFRFDPVAHAPAGAEPLEAFRDRIGAGLAELTVKHPGTRVLVVCHAGTIRMAMCLLLGIPLRNLFRIQVPYAGLTRITLSTGPDPWQGRLLFHAGTLD